MEEKDEAGCACRPGNAGTSEQSARGSLGDRTKYLGASEVPIVMGSLYLPEYGVTRWHLWASKVGHPDYVPRATGEEAELGTALEAALLKWAKRRWTVYTNSWVTEIAIPDSPIVAHLDGVGQEGSEFFPIECKTAGLLSGKARGWSEETIPWHVYHQVQTQIAALKAKRAVVIALLGGFGRTYYEYEVYRDDAVIAQIMAESQRFWKHVETQTSPGERPFDMELAVRVERTGAVELPDSAVALLEVYHSAKETIAAAEGQLEAARRELLRLLESAERGHVKGWTVVAKRVKQERLDSRKLKLEFPRTYRECLTETCYLQLRVKPPKKGEHA